MKTLLVASEGGHLAQLHMLSERMGPAVDRVWVTFHRATRFLSARKYISRRLLALAISWARHGSPFGLVTSCVPTTSTQLSVQAQASHSLSYHSLHEKVRTVIISKVLREPMGPPSPALCSPHFDRFTFTRSTSAGLIGGGSTWLQSSMGSVRSR